MTADEEEGDFQNFAESAAGAQIDFGQTPMGRTVKAMKEQKASWQTDGLGIRGQASIVSNASARLEWPASGVTRRTDPEMDGGSTAVDAEVPTEDN